MRHICDIAKNGECGLGDCRIRRLLVSEVADVMVFGCPSKPPFVKEVPARKDVATIVTKCSGGYAVTSYGLVVEYVGPHKR